jgi:glycosyltransferase involved in cell wall biosynthesis
VLKKSQKCLANSQAIIDEAMRLGLDKSKAELILFGIDVKKFIPKKVEQKSKIIFCPRAIKPVYNSLALVKAFKQVIKTKPSLKLELMEFNAQEAYLKRIKDFVKRNRLDKKVIFLGPVPNEQMANYYQKAELVISIPQWDSASVSFLEAAACNKKIVVSDLPYLSEWPEVKVWTTESSDFNSIATAILTAIDASVPDNRKRIINRIDLNRNFEKLETLYKSLK